MLVLADNGFLEAIAVFGALGSIVVHLVFAMAVLFDSPSRNVLMGRAAWIFATLVGGVFVAATYWVLHHGLPVREVSVPDSPPPSANAD